MARCAATEEGYDAGGIFIYYLISLRPLMRATWDRGFAVVACFVVAVAVVFGFTGIGSPSHERALAADERRATDLGFVESEIAHDYATSHRLPQTLLTLDPENTHDPVSRQLYAYKPGPGSLYVLCATFQTANDEEHPIVKWRHKARAQCFTRNAKP